MNLLDNEKLIIKNLLADKVDLAERHIKKLNKDYKYYTEERANWIPGMNIGDPNSKYAKEIKRQITLEEDKIKKYNNIIRKVMEL